MTYVLAKAKMRSIIEATELTVNGLGAGTSFSFDKQAHPKRPPTTTRGYYLWLERGAHWGYFTSRDTRRAENVATLSWATFYKDPADADLLDQMMIEDYDAGSKRLLQPSLWDGAITGIIIISSATEQLLPYTRVAVPGGYEQRATIEMRFR